MAPAMMLGRRAVGKGSAEYGHAPIVAGVLVATGRHRRAGESA
jgi:hypothetical protein